MCVGSEETGESAVEWVKEPDVSAGRSHIKHLICGGHFVTANCLSIININGELKVNEN